MIFKGFSNLIDSVILGSLNAKRLLHHEYFPPLGSPPGVSALPLCLKESELLLSLQKTLRDKELEGLQVKIQRLGKLCRALQTERNDLNKKVQDLCAHVPRADTDLGEPLKDPPRDSSDAVAPAEECLNLGKPTQSPDPAPESLGELSIGALGQSGTEGGSPGAD